MMKKIGYIFLVLIMLVNLSACGSKRAKSKDSNVGMWKAVSASMMGVTQDIKDVLEKGASLELKENGKLADLAPTMLELMGIKKPKEMTGESLLKK